MAAERTGKTEAEGMEVDAMATGRPSQTAILDRLFLRTCTSAPSNRDYAATFARHVCLTDRSPKVGGVGAGDHGGPLGVVGGLSRPSRTSDPRSDLIAE